MGVLCEQKFEKKNVSFIDNGDGLIFRMSTAMG